MNDMQQKDSSPTNHDVIIVGGGPTGMMLAGELALAGINVLIVEKRTTQELDGSRARGLHSRTIEVLDQRGIAERFIEAGQTAQVQGFAGTILDISDFPTRHNYGLALLQSRFEPILADWIAELGVPTLRGREVVGFTQDDSGVDVELDDGQTLRSLYLAGCDGGRSLIRKMAGIEFAGYDPTTSWIIAEVEMDEEPELGMRHDSIGTHGMNRVGPNGPIGLVITEPPPAKSGEPDIEELRAGIIMVYGTDFGLKKAHWISRFTDMARQAESYRNGRVLLAGDAAHIHPPQGGQGLGIGVQDAVNLGWKLAQVVKGWSPESLLDTYHAERHPVGARVLQNTMAAVAISRQDDRHRALQQIIGELLTMEEPRKKMAGMFSGLDIRYDLGEGHPLLGRRMPDLDLLTAEGPLRLFTLLHGAHPILLNLGEPGRIGIAPWNNRVQLVEATCDGEWELPVIGYVVPPKAVLIRPDGYVAWVGEGKDDGLVESLARWFGSGGVGEE